MRLANTLVASAFFLVQPIRAEAFGAEGHEVIALVAQ
jgi:hypothetical protein